MAMSASSSSSAPRAHCRLRRLAAASLATCAALASSLGPPASVAAAASGGASGIASSSSGPMLRPPPLGRKLRVLALHGGGSNSNVMKYQVQALKKALGDKAEWDFMNGGRPWKWDNGMEPPAIMKSLAGDLPFFGWYGVETEDVSDRPYQEKLFDVSVKFSYLEVDAGVDRVMRHIKENGPFDVLLGFSQGCIVSHLIAALLRERGESIPWRLSLLFCGMRVRDTKYERLFETRLPVPSIQIYGRKDEFYDYGKASQEALYEDPVILEHDEGHRFPSLNPKAKEIYEEVAKQVFWHCGVDAA